MRLGPIGRTFLGLAGLVVLGGGIAALFYRDWIAGLSLAALGIASVFAAVTGLDPTRGDFSWRAWWRARRQLPAAEPPPYDSGLHTPPTVPWGRDHDRTA